MQFGGSSILREAYKGYRGWSALQLSSVSSSDLFASVKSDSDNPLHFKRIYVFPFIREASLINRLKLLHTTLTGLATPTSMILHYANVLPEAYKYVFACGFIGIIPLYTLGVITNRLVGAVYLNENDSVKISYLNFWGKRTDVICDTQDIIPFSDLSCDKNDIYLKLERYSSKEKLYITIKYGNVVHKKCFDKLFYNHLA